VSEAHWEQSSGQRTGVVCGEVGGVAHTREKLPVPTPTRSPGQRSTHAPSRRKNAFLHCKQGGAVTPTVDRTHRWQLRCDPQSVVLAGPVVAPVVVAVVDAGGRVAAVLRA
jgi:hypothetical protein